MMRFAQLLGKGTQRGEAATKTHRRGAENAKVFERRSSRSQRLCGELSAFFPRRYAKKAEYTEKIFPKIQETGG